MLENYKSTHENCLKHVLKLEELIFNKNPNFFIKDYDINTADPTSFNYYSTHDFYKRYKNIRINNSDRLPNIFL